MDYDTYDGDEDVRTSRGMRGLALAEAEFRRRGCSFEPVDERRVPSNPNTREEPNERYRALIRRSQSLTVGFYAKPSDIASMKANLLDIFPKRFGHMGRDDINGIGDKVLAVKYKNLLRYAERRLADSGNKR